MAKPTDGHREEAEEIYRYLLDKIFEEAARQGHIPKPDEAMRQLRSDIIALAGNTPAAGQDARLGAKLYRAAYRYALRRFFKEGGGIRAGRPRRDGLRQEAVALKEEGRKSPQIAALLNQRHGAETDYVPVSSEAVRKLLRTSPSKQG